jgi:hypothetical protein
MLDADMKHDHDSPIVGLGATTASLEEWSYLFRLGA